MRLTAGACDDAAAAETTTASGSWSSRGGKLVLEVSESSDAVFRGATMIDTIETLDASTLVLESSVVVCGGQQVRLARQ